MVSEYEMISIMRLFAIVDLILCTADRISAYGNAMYTNEVASGLIIYENKPS